MAKTKTQTRRRPRLAKRLGRNVLAPRSSWRDRPPSDPWLIPKRQRRRPPALSYGVLPDIVVLCGRPRDGVPCSGVIYQLECFVCGSRDRSYRTAYRRAGADALAAATDKMSERGGQS